MIAPTSPHVLFTIGYEGLDLPGFVKYLTYHKIEVLVDVRELPSSRKRGFSKTLLSETLSKEGIRYEHIRALGSPRNIRNQLKADHDYPTFFAKYDDYLAEQDEALDKLTQIIEEHDRVCLMCFESANEQCHRSRVADRMASTFKDRLNIEPVKTWV